MLIVSASSLIVSTSGWIEQLASAMVWSDSFHCQSQEILCCNSLSQAAAAEATGTLLRVVVFFLREGE